MEKLIEWLDAERGRRVVLSGALGIGPSALSQWQQVPAEKVLMVEAITGISKHVLRPDVFGPALPVATSEGRAA